MTTPPGTAAPIPLSRPERSLRALAALRDQVRRAFLLDGWAALILAALILIPLAFFLDFMLVLPAAVRGVILVSGTGYLIWTFIRRVVRPAGLKLGEEDLAVLLEARVGDLRQVLVTAVELTRPNHPSAAYLSPELIRKVVNEAEEASSAIQAGRVIDWRPVRLNLVCAGLLGLTLVVGGLARPDLAGTWMRRFFLFSNDRWPKSTELELVLPIENPIRVALGDDLLVKVRAVRGAPSKVEIEAEGNDGGRWRDPMYETAGGMFQKVFENVSRGFRFHVQGGDDELPEVEVKIWIQPGLARLDTWFRYPEHTALPPTPAERPVSNPSLITAPVGTEVLFRAYTDLPVKQAFLVFKSREETAAEKKTAPSAADPPPAVEVGAVPLAVEPAAAKPPPVDPAAAPLPVPERVAFQCDGSFRIERDGLFLFRLVGLDGMPGRGSKVVGVRAVPDRPPTPRIVKPARASEEASPEASVAMEFFIRDDYGVKSATLETVVFGADDKKGQARSFPLTLGESQARNDRGEGGARSGVEYKPVLQIDLATLPGIAPKARFQYYLQAEDFAGNRGESERYVLHILSKDEIDRMLKDRLMQIRDQLRDVLRQQESARKDLQNFAQQLEAAASGEEAGRLPIDAAAGSKLGRNRQDEERVTAGLRRAAKEFELLLDRMQANRVGDEKEKMWISGLQAEVDSLATQGSAQIEKMIEDLRAEALQKAQPLAALDPILEKESRLERDLSMLVSRLSEFGDLNAVIQQLRDILIRQQDIRQRTRTRAQGEGSGQPEAGTPPPGGREKPAGGGDDDEDGG